MPPKRTLDWDDPASIALFIPSRKGKVTRIYNQIKDFVLLPPTRSSLEFAEQYLEDAFSEFEKLVASIRDLDPDSYTKNPNSIKDLYDNKYAKAIKSIVQYMAYLAPFNGRGGGADNANNSGVEEPSSRHAKLDKFLQPALLLHTSTPSQLHRWEKDLRIFFDSGNLSSRSNDFQQQYTYKCMEESWAETTQLKVGPRAPVFGTGSIVASLYEHFKTSNPIFTRRSEYFSRTAGPDCLNYSKYLEELISLSREAQMDRITLEELNVLGSWNPVRTKSYRKGF